MEIEASITGIKYQPFLCKKLNCYQFNKLKDALNRETTFILNLDDNNTVAISWWVSPKRTRSYPYTRVYDSLSFSGKKITIIPVLKDEGIQGDRDFIQWDTLALMSLLGVNVIITYYIEAERSQRYSNKITKQKFDIKHLEDSIRQLTTYQSDALHWNLAQAEKIGTITEKALKCYDGISEVLGVKMHSKKTAFKRISRIKKSKEEFIKLSRTLAQSAQRREIDTIQPKEKLNGTKARITIKNYLGGKYYLTSDEVLVKEKNIYLIDGKHTKNDKLPSLHDIKDALMKMILFTNLEKVKVDNRLLNPVPVVKLTTGKGFSLEKIPPRQRNVLEVLKKEAKTNNFKIIINDKFVVL